VMFSLFRTRTSDLSEFGIGHMLYFYFLRCTSLAFAVLTLILGVPLAFVYAAHGSFFSSGTLWKLTLGNYGPLYAVGDVLAGGVVRAHLQ
jgi:hypothetical protein